MLYEDSTTMFYSIIWVLVVLKQVIFVHPDFLIYGKWHKCVLVYCGVLLK